MGYKNSTEDIFCSVKVHNAENYKGQKNSLRMKAILKIEFVNHLLPQREIYLLFIYLLAWQFDESSPARCKVKVYSRY